MLILLDLKQERGLMGNQTNKGKYTYLYRSVESKYQIELDDVIEFIEQASDYEISEIKIKLGVELESSHFYNEMVNRIFKEALEKYSLNELERRLK